MSYEEKCGCGNNCLGSRCPQYEAQIRAGRALCLVFGVVSKETAQPVPRLNMCLTVLPAEDIKSRMGFRTDRVQLQVA